MDDNVVAIDDFRLAAAAALLFKLMLLSWCVICGCDCGVLCNDDIGVWLLLLFDELETVLESGLLKMAEDGGFIARPTDDPFWGSN
ncbi:unnamed protein product [Ambrosiozyma monospora]|uniref:Unnamed protein product n=1 Tax=Ambrosiozyma monospora TaxID=43982 RepID=A0ACB5UCI5_AMBMO|nr:unnamed protein product [Ambrosiozyma monospora]